MSEDPVDTHIRLAAVEYIKRLSAGGVITAEELRAGFFVDGLRIPLLLCIAVARNAAASSVAEAPA